MTDEADRADAEIEYELAESMRRRRPEGPAPTGFCLYCGEPVTDDRRFCPGTGCGGEWEYERERRAANGIV